MAALYLNSRPSQRCLRFVPRSVILERKEAKKRYQRLKERYLECCAFIDNADASIALSTGDSMRDFQLLSRTRSLLYVAMGTIKNIAALVGEDDDVVTHCALEKKAEAVHKRIDALMRELITKK